jgi:hypothetical protein
MWGNFLPFSVFIEYIATAVLQAKGGLYRKPFLKELARGSTVKVATESRPKSLTLTEAPGWDWIVIAVREAIAGFLSESQESS